jgi:hypothetical protein
MKYIDLKKYNKYPNLSHRYNLHRSVGFGQYTEQKAKQMKRKHDNFLILLGINDGKTSCC